MNLKSCSTIRVAVCLYINEGMSEAKLAKDTKQSQLARAEERLAIDEIKRAATDSGEDVPEADKQGICCAAKQN